MNIESFVKAFLKLILLISIVIFFCISCSVTNWQKKVDRVTHNQVERKLGPENKCEEFENGYFTHEWLTKSTAVYTQPKPDENNAKGPYGSGFVQITPIDYYNSVWTKFTFNSDSILVKVTKRNQKLDKNKAPIE